jgi:hypothetical protein
MTLAQKVAKRYLAAAVVRPPRFLDTTEMAQRLDRFEFVLEFTAWRTRDKKGRTLSSGMQVLKLSNGGWRVGYPDVGDGAWQDYRDARMAYEHLRRTGAGHYTTEADDLRISILTP